MGKTGGKAICKELTCSIVPWGFFIWQFMLPQRHMMLQQQMRQQH